MFLTTVRVRELRQHNRALLADVGVNLDEYPRGGAQLVEVMAHGELVAVAEAKLRGPRIVWTRPGFKAPEHALQHVVTGGVAMMHHAYEAGLTDRPQKPEAAAA